MKIGPPVDKPVHAPGTPERKTTAETSSPGAAPADASAKVLLSDAVTNLLAGKEPLSAEFDKAKVERIAQAIADGKFTVNPAAVADKLIANANELLGKASH
jgi:negative regulator of flagellin synthesis FlgM